MTDNPFERAKARLDGGRAWGSAEGLGTRDCIESACGIGWTWDGITLPWEAREAARKILRSVLGEQYPEERARYGGEVISWAWNDNLYLDEGPAAYPKVEAILDKAAQRWDESR